MTNFDESFVSLLKTKKIMICGAGRSGQIVNELLRLCDLYPFCYIDNDKKKHGTRMENIPVLGMDDINMEDDTEIFLVALLKSEEIIAQLLSKGVDNSIICNMSNYIKGKIPDFLLTKAYDKMKIEKCFMEHYKYLFENSKQMLKVEIKDCQYINNIVMINGCILQRRNYNKVEIYVNDCMAGTAELDMEKQGFRFLQEMEELENICVTMKVYCDEELVWEYCCNCKNRDVTEVIHELLNNKKYVQLSALIEKILKTKNLVNYQSKILNYVNSLYNTVNTYKKIDLLHLLYHIQCFNTDWMETYMDEMDKVDDVWTRLWLCEQDVPWMLFLHPEYIVPSFYQWRRKQLLKLADEIFQIASLPVKKDGNKNIAIIVDGLADKVYSSAIFEMAIANELDARGYSVTIYTLDSSYDTEEVKTDSVTRKKSESIRFWDSHKKMKQESVKIWYGNASSHKEQLFNCYNAIISMSPEFLIDISHAGIVLAAALKNYFPVIHIALSGYSTSAIFDRCIVKSKEQCLKENETYHSIHLEEMFECPLYAFINLKSRKIYYRDELGLGEHNFLMITVGNRLKYELTESFIKHVCGLLEKYEDVKWIIVGNNLGEVLPSSAQKFIDNGQVIRWGFENDLKALYSICDIYVNPDRIGGGGSVLLAMEMGMPVVLTDFFADITPIIKKENCHYKNYEEMMLYAEELYQNPRFCALEGKRMKDILKRDELSTKYYVDVILEAYKDISR